MSLPDPERGLVVKYGYLWHADARDGHQEGKDRPCLIVAVTAKDDGRVIASVAPITHSQPRDSDSACPVPQQTAHRLGLDHDQSWIVTTEVNRFEWPGADLRPVSRDRWTYGFMPSGLQQAVQDQLRENVARQRLRATNRDE